MSDPSEELLGELWVSTNLRFGSERIRLLLTSTRIIVDHAAKKGPGAVAGRGLLGDLSAGLESLLKSGRNSVARRHVDQLSPSQVLRAHKDNFAISNREVVNVLVEQALPSNKVTILTGDDKFEFVTSTLSDKVATLFLKSFEDRLTFRKSGPTR